MNSTLGSRASKSLGLRRVQGSGFRVRCESCLGRGEATASEGGAKRPQGAFKASSSPYSEALNGYFARKEGSSLILGFTRIFLSPSIKHSLHSAGVEFISCRKP